MPSPDQEPTDATKPRVYSVPRRFSLAAIFAITALFAVVFGLLKWIEVPPVRVTSIGLFIIVIGVTQMIFHKTPRVASILTGAVSLPLILFGFELSSDRPNASVPPMVIMDSFCSAALGAVFGYVVGFTLAGIFLVLDRIPKVSQPTQGESQPPEDRDDSTSQEQP